MMTHCDKIIAFALTLTCLCLLSATPQKNSSNEADIALTIEGEVARPLSLTGEDLAKLAHSRLTSVDESGKFEYETISLPSILALAGYKLDKENLAAYLVVESADGSRIVFSLPEIDAAFTAGQVVLADKQDGQRMGQDEGPLRIIAYSDKHKARWVKQVRKLIIMRADRKKVD